MTTSDPAGARPWETPRRLAMVTCDRLTTMAATIGTATTSEPARMRSTSPNSRPHSAAVSPPATRQRARVVKPGRIRCMVLVTAGVRRRDRDRGDHLRQDLLGSATADAGVRGEQQAVRQHRAGQALQVIRDDVV